jgi:hypothetical protein
MSAFGISRKTEIEQIQAEPVDGSDIHIREAAALVIETTLMPFAR